MSETHNLNAKLSQLNFCALFTFLRDCRIDVQEVETAMTGMHGPRDTVVARVVTFAMIPKGVVYMDVESERKSVALKCIRASSAYAATTILPVRTQ